MAYVSEDFVTWTFHRIEPYFMFAPTVAVHNNRFYLVGNLTPLYVADDPLGPFTELGSFRTVAGEPLQVLDPMIFPDDDGRLYLYWGLSDPGIFGAELDPADPCQLLTEPRFLFAFNPEHEWERFGEWNENKYTSSIEGPWMAKVNGVYYLTYCGPGTVYSTYAMGTYTCSYPLGEFTYAARNPILSNKHGLIKGPGHGCIVAGPGETLWAFYTICVCYEHKFERRIGVDPAGIDENGNLYVLGPSEIPQHAPGVLPSPQLNNNTGWSPLTFCNPRQATSCVEGRNPVYAFDDSLLTWWQPSPEDRERELTVDFRALFEVRAFRIMWRDVQLDYDNDLLPGPFGYIIEVLAELPPEQSVEQPPKQPLHWVPVIDKSDNDTDLLIDYLEIAGIQARSARLKIISTPPGIEPGVVNFTAFGTAFSK